MLQIGLKMAQTIPVIDIKDIGKNKPKGKTRKKVSLCGRTTKTQLFPNFLDKTRKNI